jgi:predicted esterase
MNTVRRGLTPPGLAWMLWVAVGLARAAEPVAVAPEQVVAPGEAVDPVDCRRFPGQSYALYLPSHYTPQKKWPILYAFDARQRGAVPLERYRAAAERLGWIVVSSNNSRSDESMEPNIEAMKAMWEDSHERLSIDPRRAYATGFSGGARVAVLLAQARRGEVAGVIGHGGGFPFESRPETVPPFAFFGLAGFTDFNFPELLTLDRRLGELGATHRFESFDGAHQWAPAEESGLALEWMELIAMRDGLVARRADFLETFWSRSLSVARRWLDQGDPVAALGWLDGTVSDFEGLRSEQELASLRERAAAVRKSEEYAREVASQAKAEEEHARFVAQASGRLSQLLALEPGSLPAAAAVSRLGVPALREQAVRHPSPYARRAAQRSIEALFVQTSFYVPRDLLAKKQFARAVFAAEIATQIKAESLGAWYGLATTQALAGDLRGAVRSLRTAAAKGDLAAEAVRSNPDFSALLGREDFRRLLGELAAAHRGKSGTSGSR